MTYRFIFLICLSLASLELWANPPGTSVPLKDISSGLSGYVTRFSNGAYFVSDPKKRAHTYISPTGESILMHTGEVDTAWDNVNFQKSQWHDTAYSYFAKEPKLIFIESGPKLFLVTEGGKRTDLFDGLMGLQHHSNGPGSKSVWATSISALLIYEQEFRLLQFMYDGKDVGPSFLLRSDGVFLKLGDLPHRSWLDLSDGTLTISGGGLRINPSSLTVQKARVDPKARKLTVLNENNDAVEARDLVFQSFTLLNDEVLREAIPSVDEEELEQIRRALAKKQVGSAMITGETGEGKSTLLKAFVKNVGLGRYTEISATTEFIVVDSSSMGQGTRYTGAYESRLKALVEYARDAHVVIVLDEAHSLKGSGTSEKRPIDFFERLKPYLADGSIKILGTTTIDDYQEHFASDAALARRLPEVKKKALDPLRVPERLNEWAQIMEYPELSENIRSHIAYVADEFDSAGSLLSRALRLQEELFLEMAFKKLSVDAVDEDFVNGVAAQLYSVDKAQLILGNVEEKFSRLKRHLEKILGYELFKEKLLLATLRFLTRTSDLSKPNGRYFLTGPKGIGKTFFARTFAEGMGYPFERVDLSQYQTQFEVNNLLDRIGGALAKNPFTVFLIDEIDKTPRMIQDALLSVLDSDHIKAKSVLSGHSRLGAQVRFKTNNATFFLASNAGSNFILQSVADGGGYEKPMNIRQLEESMINEGISEFLLDRSTVVPVYPARNESEFKQVMELKFGEILQRIERQSARAFKYDAGDRDQLTTRVAGLFFAPGASYRKALDHLDEEIGNAAMRALLRGVHVESSCEALVLEFN